MAEPVKNGGTGMKPWLRAVLVVSLGLNLLVAGIVGGRLLTWDRHHRHDAARLEQYGGPLTRALSQEDREEIGRAMRRAIRADREARAAQGGDMFAALIADLRADPFDRAAVAAHMARQRGHFSERLSLGQGILLDRLEQMGPEARAAFADRLQEGLERHRRGRKGD